MVRNLSGSERARGCNSPAPLTQALMRVAGKGGQHSAVPTYKRRNKAGSEAAIV